MSEEKTIIAENPNLTILQGSKRKNACVVQYSGAKLGKRYPLSEPVNVIGRSPSVQIIINEASVSRQHARLVVIGDNVVVEDMGSSNGTFVNDVRTDGQSQLKDGDIIRLGTVLLKFFAHDNVDSVMHDKIYRMATIDAGTQIFNKQYLLDALEAEIKFSRTYGRDLSIIYYDLDHFKPVNDTYGHNAGDFILRESAALVRTTVRKDDILGRFGGEEFVIILPNTDARTAAELAERIRQKHESHEFLIEYEKDGDKARVNHRQTISIGVAQLRPPVASTKEFLEVADKKLYNSKQTGRNRVTT
jgi:two-component system, cell cycle response regulator